MCVFGKTPSIPQVSPAPTRRQGGPISALFSQRSTAARGSFGNIFTSPLGVANFGESAKATKLGGTSTPASF